MTEAERIVRASVQRAAALASLKDPAGRAATRELLRDLKAADVRLTRGLAKMAVHGDLPFTAARAHAMRAQMRVTVQFMEARLLGLTEEQAIRAVASGVKSTGNLLFMLEKSFKGVAAPLSVRQASVMSRLREGTRASLLAQHETSVSRYGDAMTQAMERRIRQGILDGKTINQMVDDLVQLKGPSGRVSIASFVKNGRVVSIAEENIKEGLFVRYRSWAERIVRTETANAFEEANLRSLYEARSDDMPDLGKKILAVFDNRTAPDSIAVHGQVRKLEGYFIDGAGREYLRPPGRPNDRETVIPWRMSWQESAETRQVPAKEAAKAIVAGSRVTIATRKQAAESGAAMRLAQANQSAVALRAQQTAARAQARRGEAAVSAEQSGRLARRRK